jgi:hypothetical protein
MAASNGEGEAALGCKEAAVGGGGARSQLARGDWNWKGENLRAEDEVTTMALWDSVEFFLFGKFTRGTSSDVVWLRSAG